MQALLGLLLFSVLFTTGASLRCETCTSYGKTCTGPWKKCAVGQDTCLIFLNEVTVGVLKTLISVKGCSDSEGCDNGPLQLEFGQGISMRANAVCCKGDACGSAFPHLPVVKGEPNGLQCPACYSVTDTCPEEMVPCRGSDDTCFYTVVHRYDGLPVHYDYHQQKSLALHHQLVALPTHNHVPDTERAKLSAPGDIAVQTTLKGCSTEEMCARFKTGTLTFGGFDNTFTRVECRQARHHNRHLSCSSSWSSCS